MGREIRRVPADWEHPKFAPEEVRYAWQNGAYHPLYDQDYNSACEEWYREAAAWTPDKSLVGCRWYHEYNGAPPDEAYYRARAWTAEEATHYQVYETVSEGTPVTPHFATKEALIEHLVAHGDAWDQKRGNGGWTRAAAESFVHDEFAPSMMVLRTGSEVIIHEPRHGRPPPAGARD